MIRSLNALLVVMIFLQSCAVKEGGERAAIDSVMEGQAAAWNKGDIEGYMKGYWMSDSLVFTGRTSVSYGWQAALDRYKKSYPNKETMGRLEFDNVDTRFTSDQSAYSVGQWTLFRSQDTLSGRFTLVWKKVHGAWFIAADHSS